MITTILTIPKDERDSIEEICAIIDTKVRFFTNEANDQLLMVEFSESDPGIMFRIGKMVGIRRIDNYLNRPSL